MKGTRIMAEEQFPIAEKRESQVKVAQSSSSLQLPTDISQPHTSGLTLKLEHDTWPSQKPSEVKPRSVCSATDALDKQTLLHTTSLSNRPVLPESWFPSTPEEGALASHIFTISQRGSTTSITSDRVLSAPTIPFSTEPHNMTASTKGRETDRILTLEQQWSAIYRAQDRRRTTLYASRASAPAFERSDEDYPSIPPHLSVSVVPNSRSIIPATKHSRSSDSPSSTVPIGYSYSSNSPSSTGPMEYSRSPSSSQLSLPFAI